VRDRPHTPASPARPERWLPLLVLALLLPGLARAASRIEGYYEIWEQVSLDDQTWRAGKPRHYSELKVLTNHSADLETFLKLGASSDYDDDLTELQEFQTPPWISWEGHMKIRGGKQELLLFNNENRYWFNDVPLFYLTEEYKFRSPHGQGMRLEFWDRSPVSWLGTWGGSVLLSDNGGTYTGPDGGPLPDGEDAMVVRLRNRSFGDRIVAGASLMQKDWSHTWRDDRETAALQHNTVSSVDVAFFPRELDPSGLNLGPLDLEQSRVTVEYARSQSPYASDPDRQDNRHAFGVELRDLYLNDLIFHAWYFDVGENFRSTLAGNYDDGGGGYNRRTKHVEGIWYVPRKAITAKVVWEDKEKRVADEALGGLRPETNWYGELYIEFINGFKGKVAYSRWRGYDGSQEVNDFYTYPNWFAELSVENFLAKIRIQARLRDAGTFRELTAYGFDMNVNMTSRVKGYLRMLNVNENVRARQTLFAQLKYDLGWGADLYFEYGDAGQSEHLVNTDGFVVEGSGSKLTDRFALSFKTWF